MQGSTFTAAYTLGNDLLRRNGEYPAFDGLGSARAEANSSGTATATQDFDAFGNTIASSGSTSSPYNFAAGWAYASLACPERSRGGDAGLQHVGARYYDPQVGRFASRDSMLDQIPYAYCGHEPVDWVDPSGHDWGAIGAIIGGAIGTFVGGVIGGAVVPVAGGVPGGMIGGGVGAAIGGWIGDHFGDHKSGPEMIQDGLINFGGGILGGGAIRVVNPKAELQVIIIIIEKG